MPNRLASQTSPYLLQHQHNPVDWWPWSRQAFDEAARRDVPVFLSVGYSTCYWCHVMERQVFESAAIAQLMNEHFVNIKVDREERPDVDEHYMTATQVLAGQGGWPMSVFLTPGGEPFFAGTYFPPEDHYGRPGFPKVVEAISEAWRERRADIEQTIETLRGILHQLSEPVPPSDDVTIDQERLAKLVERSGADYEPRFGGFGAAPKFPRQTLLETLLAARPVLAAQAARPHLARLNSSLCHTLDAMANGGIRDHLGGGFHRYSTDARWLVPHFEIMLYDQAMHAWVYAEAARQFASERYARVARGICDFVLGEMTSPAGGFYTAFDAEVDAAEGGSYLWGPAEVEAVLGPEDAAAFNEVYGLDQGFNFADPHGPNPHAPDRNVLFLAHPEREDDPRITDMRRKLKAARDERKGPLLDTKIITSWNALMIRALAHTGAVLDEARYVAAAARAADWLWREHRGPEGALLHTSRPEAAAATGGSPASAPAIPGFLDDYAFFGWALLSLHSATREDQWRQRAMEIADYLQEHFEDVQRGAFYFSDTSRDELAVMTGIRRKIAGDSPLPSGNAAAAMLMLELDRPEACRRTLQVFAGQIVDHPGNASALLGAAIRYVQTYGPFTVGGSAAPHLTTPSSEAEQALELVAAQWLTSQRLELTVRVAEPFHVYTADAQQAQAISITSPHPAFEGAAAPAGQGGQLRGEVAFTVSFSRPASDEAIELALSYQACDESRCLLPVTKNFRVGPVGGS